MVVHEKADEIDKKNWSLNFTPVTENATQKCARKNQREIENKFTAIELIQ